MAKRLSRRISRLEQLPEPLLEDIFGHLILHDLLAARLVSKLLSTTASVLVPGVRISSEDLAQASHVLQTFPQVADLLPSLRSFQNGGVRESLGVTDKYRTRLDSLRVLDCYMTHVGDAMRGALITTLTRLEVERSQSWGQDPYPYIVGPPTPLVFKVRVAALTGLKSLCVRGNEVAYGIAEWLRDLRQLTSLTLRPTPGKRKKRTRNNEDRLDLRPAPLPRLRALNLEVIITPALLSEIARLTLLEHLTLCGITPGTPEKLTPEMVQQSVTPLTCLTYLKLDRFPFGALRSLHALFTGSLEGAPGDGQHRCDHSDGKSS